MKHYRLLWRNWISLCRFCAPVRHISSGRTHGICMPLRILLIVQPLLEKKAGKQLVDKNGPAGFRTLKLYLYLLGFYLYRDNK